MVVGTIGETFNGGWRQRIDLRKVALSLRLCVQVNLAPRCDLRAGTDGAVKKSQTGIKEPDACSSGRLDAPCPGAQVRITDGPPSAS